MSTTMEFGPGPTMEEALAEILRVGALIGGALAAQWAQELREIVARLDAGSRWGPRGVVWGREAARLMLAADVAEYGHQRRAALDGAKALTVTLPKLAAKTTDSAEELEVAALGLDLEVAVRGELEQARMDPKGRPLGGKAMADMDAGTERRFCFLLEAIGGRPADGRGRLGADALACDDATFERGAQLWYGEAEPETDAERVALDRWRS